MIFDNFCYFLLPFVIIVHLNRRFSAIFAIIYTSDIFLQSPLKQAY